MELLCLAAISASFATFLTYVFFFLFVFLTVVFLSWYCCRSFSFLVICFLVQFNFSLPPCLSSFPCVVCNPVLPPSFPAAQDLFTDVCDCILSSCPLFNNDFPSSNVWYLSRSEIPSSCGILIFLKFSSQKPSLYHVIRLLLCW